MKKLFFFYFLISVLSLTSCGTDDTETNPEGGIIADFSFTSDGNLFQFTNLSKGATSYRWDFGDLNFYCEKENPTYRYTKKGGEIKVTLTAMNDKGQENYITKTIIAPEVLNVTIKIDGKFEEWKNIGYLYEEPDGISVKKIKIWGKGDFVNVYLEGNKTMKMELVDMYINADGNPSSGFLSWQWPQGSGGDFLFEGPLLSNSWGSFYKHTDPAGGWGWAELAGSGVNMAASGIVSIDTNTNAIEFAIPKTQLGTLGNTIGFAFSELTSGWAAVGNFPKVTGTSKFVTYELPKESLALCQ